MEIVWLGHSSFRIKGKSGTVITDPFDPQMVGLPFPKDQEANIVTISHSHPDHNYPKAIKGDFKVFSTPGEYEVGGISLVGVSTYHDDKNGAVRGKNISFIIEMDQIRTLHLGDLGHKLTQEQLDQIGPVHIVLVPTGGEFTIGPQQAVEVVNQLEPVVVIPMHYQQPKLNPANFKLAPVEEFLRALGVAGVKEVKYTISYEKLPEELTVVVLESRS